MEFEAATFIEAPVSQDLSKPIVATASFAPGQVIFAEAATVASAGGMEDPFDDVHEENCEDEECGGCAELEEDDIKDALDEEEEDEVDPYVVDNYDELMEACDPLEPLAAFDLRKNLFKLFHLIETDAKALDSLLPLEVNPEDMSANLDAAKSLREAHPAVVPTVLTDDHVAHLIGVLEKHSFPLEDLQGSGLFLFVSKIKHSCTPNATYTDAGNMIWLTAIKPIAVGETISVDFYDTHFMSVEQRAELLGEEGVVCDCDICSGNVADKARAFKCVADGCKGIVHPTKNVFTCETCKATFDEATIAEVEMEEKTLLDDLEVESYDQVVKTIADSKLHAYHHIFYAAMEVLSEDDEEVDEDDEEAGENSNALTKEQIISVILRQLEAINYVVSTPLTEKVTLYDALAQAYVSQGEINQATEAYTNAYNQSKIVFGEQYESTRLFKNLMENTPKNEEELAAAYGNDEDDEAEEA